MVVIPCTIYLKLTLVKNIHFARAGGGGGGGGGKGLLLYISYMDMYRCKGYSVRAI